jgi:hypothetical protein
MGTTSTFFRHLENLMAAAVAQLPYQDCAGNPWSFTQESARC